MDRLSRKGLKMAKKRTCSECGGPARGRGYSHKPSCSLHKAKGSGRPRGGFGVASLRAMSVDELVGLRDLVSQVMADKAGEIDTEIARLQELKKSVKAMAGK